MNNSSLLTCVTSLNDSASLASNILAEFSDLSLDLSHLLREHVGEPFCCFCNLRNVALQRAHLSKELLLFYGGPGLITDVVVDQ
jgi:hypothetical protein